VDLHLPPGPGPHPVTVVIHGGFWRAKYGKRVSRAIAADLARRGRAAWNIEYRRIGRGQGGGWPATFDDVAAAIDLLAQRADPRLDLDDVSVIGHSAGGQLALWAATRRNGALTLRRVVAQAAPCDLRAAGAAHDLLGGTPDEVPERYAQANPTELVPIGVPVLLVHGEEDETVPVRRSREFATTARAAGDDVTLIEPLPGGHRTHIDPRTAAWRAAADWLTRPKENE
jgi:acetyl esterase/lipase